VAYCDDAQWADEATLAVLGRLARHAPRRALLLLLAYRSEELSENNALHELLRTLGRAMLLRPLVLGGFDTAEVTQFLAGLAQVEPRHVAHLAPRLAASSGGNPLFLSVAVQALLEAHGAPSLATLLPALDASVPLPDLAGAPQIRELVLARLERLPPPARALLEQTAVIGRPVSLDLLEQLAGASALEAAQILLERQLLFESADGRLAFGHELVRSIVVATLSSPRRRLLHRQAAEAIAALHSGRPEHAAELAFHFGQTGHGAEAAVLRYATVAGDQARRSFGYREALNHYDAALRAAERLGTHAPPAEVRRAFAGLLLVHEALLDWDGIMATSARYNRWAAQHAEKAPPLVATRRLVLLRALMGDLAGAAAISAEQARRYPETVPAVHDMLWRTAIILQPAEHAPDAGDLEPGDGELHQRCLPIDPRPPGPFVPAHPLPGTPADELPALLGPDEAALTLFQVGWAALMQGLLRDAEPCLVQAYELAGETGQAAVAVIAALQLAHLNGLRGERVATDRWLNMSLDLAQQAPGVAWASIWPRIHQAFLLLLDDQHTAAQERFELMAAELQELPAFQSHRASVEVGLGLLALTRGDVTRAAARLDGALASPQLLYGFVYAAAQHGRARIAALRDDMPTARVMLDHALDYSARRSLLPEYVRTAIEIARIERDFGDPTAVLPLLRTAADLASGARLGPLATAAASLLTRLLS
jgi:tetratricopeptide (TPR) repeat protein